MKVGTYDMRGYEGFGAPPNFPGAFHQHRPYRRSISTAMKSGTTWDQ